MYFHKSNNETYGITRLNVRINNEDTDSIVEIFVISKICRQMNVERRRS